ncbi:MAG: PD-(D/E)XK nuclease family protein, partial [Clostridia bacterium]|nr:PD-(D/E)XK nuclease family protein [Clostridia bacterium]
DIQLESVEKEQTLNIDEDFMEFMSKLNEIDENTPKEVIEEMHAKLLLYQDIQKYNEILNYRRQDSNLQQQTLTHLYDKKINSSVSRLEQFKRCPFAYYTKYILNLKERKEYVMSSLDTGSFMHEVVEKFSKYIVAKNIAWQDLALDEKKKQLAKYKIDEIVDKLFEEEYSKYLTSARYVVLKSKMKKAMVRTIFAIADSFNHSEFRPLGYEIEFEKGELFAPIEVELDDGKTLLLRGKIDRIDSLTLEDKTYLRIVDYKSSEKNLKLSDIKSGISLQLMTYMCAMMENKEKLNTQSVIPTALSYFTISNKILSIPNYEKDDSKISEMVKKELKLRGIYINDIEVLKRLDNNIQNPKDSYLEVSPRTINNANKNLPQEVFIEECKNVRNILKEIGKEIVKGSVKIKPNKDIQNVCEYCSYASVCRKNILN